MTVNTINVMTPAGFPGKVKRLDAVRGTGNIFKERNQPTNYNHPHEWFMFVFKMAIPRDCHKDIRNDE